MKTQYKIRWGLAISSLFLLGLLVDFFFLHILFQEKVKEQQPRPPSYNSDSSLPKAPDANAPEAKAQITLAEISYQEPPPTADAIAKFQEKVSQCLGPELGKSQTPDSLIKDLEKSNPVLSSQFQLENTHIQLPDGSERRLHLILADNSNQKGTLELRYFKLDDEGLPVRIPLKPEETYNPKPEFLEGLKKQGTVIFHELKETKTLKDNTRMILTTIDGKAHEFQIFGRGKTLSCREMNCACR